MRGEGREGCDKETTTLLLRKTKKSLWFTFICSKLLFAVVVVVVVVVEERWMAWGARAFSVQSSMTALLARLTNGFTVLREVTSLETAFTYGTDYIKNGKWRRKRRRKRKAQVSYQSS